MKKIFLILVLPIFILSCKSNSNEKPQCFMTRLNEFPASNAPEGSEEFYNVYFASCQHTLPYFMKRVKEYPSTDPSDYYTPAFYAMSNHSISTFIKRVKESEDTLTKITGGVVHLFYAKSNHTLSEFIKRLKEFPQDTKYYTGDILYAGSDYSLSEFLKRINEFPQTKDKNGWYSVYYAASNNILCTEDDNTTKTNADMKSNFVGQWVADDKSDANYGGERITEIIVARNGDNFIFEFNKSTNMGLKTMGTVDKSNNISLYGGQWIVALDVTNKDNLFLNGEIFHRAK